MYFLSCLHTAIPTPNFCGFWHSHSYIPLHFWKMCFHRLFSYSKVLTLKICDRICENQPHCTHYQNRDGTMNDVIEVWSRSGENLEAIACIVLEIQSLEAWRVG